VANQPQLATRTCRLLYYGPAGAGKRDNLLRIAQTLPPEDRLPLAAEDPQRQLAFRLRHGEGGEWTVLIRTLDTGHETYNAGQSAAPAPFDGVVFVAHSSNAHLDQSLSSMEALKAYLDSWGQDITSVPLVLQYNAREEDGCLQVDRLESLLNPWGLLSFPASARQGEGVKETLKAILSLTLSRLLQQEEEEQAVPEPPAPPVSATPASEPPARSQPAPRPVPETDGSRLQVVAEERTGMFFDDLRPPIVVPVKIPKRLLDKFGSARLILEIQVDEGDSMLG
jgi:hypothetical protein